VTYDYQGFIINTEAPKLVGEFVSQAWDAVLTRNYYSLSIFWGILGPKIIFGKNSPYSWVYYGFVVGPIAVFITFMIHKWKPNWSIETRFNSVLILSGGLYFPVYQTANLLSSSAVSAFL
jgi:hypothetical protein